MPYAESEAETHNFKISDTVQSFRDKELTKTIDASTHRSKHFCALVHLCMLHVVYNILNCL